MGDIQTGIDTFCCYCVLTERQKSKLIDALKHKPGFYKLKDDYWDCSVSLTSTCFIDQGIKLSIFRTDGGPWGAFVIVHPALVLGACDRSMLYLPEYKRDYKQIVKRVDGLLSTVHIPYSLNHMKLSRIDVTANIVFDNKDMVEQYLHVLRKGCLLPHYHLEQFSQYGRKARDWKEANQHSYKQSCKSASFFAYDKTAQLKMIDKFPETLCGKHILRLEAQLRRKAVKRWVPKDKWGDNWRELQDLGQSAAKVLYWYLKRIQPVQAPCVRYAAAVTQIETVKNKKIRERMLYLLRKTSDSKHLTSAMKKLKQEFGLNDKQVKHILEKFHKLGINPIALPNSSNQPPMLAINQLLYI